MSGTLQYLVRHGYIVLFASVLAQQLGVPLPSTPFIVAAGALAHTGQLSFGAAIFVAFSAAMIADLVWFEIGRRRGTRVLQFLCRISLEPDYCVRRTENTFARYGAKTLIVGKLVPGISVLATPMAGVYGLARSRFLLFDGLGILLWIGTFELLGYFVQRSVGRCHRVRVPLRRVADRTFCRRPCGLRWVEVRAATQIPSLAARSAHHPGAVEGGVGLRRGPPDR